MKKVLWATCFCLALAGHCFAQQVGEPAPAFSGTTADGDVISLSDFKGKIVVLDFWASWCTPCKEEFPFLVRLHDKLKNRNFTVLAINVDTEVEKMQKFLAQQELAADFPMIHDSEGKIPPVYAVEGMPTTVLIDQNGIIRYRHTGFKEADKNVIIREIKSLLR